MVNSDISLGTSPNWGNKSFFSAWEHGLNDTPKTPFSNQPELVNLLSVPRPSLFNGFYKFFTIAKYRFDSFPLMTEMSPNLHGFISLQANCMVSCSCLNCRLAFAVVVVKTYHHGPIAMVTARLELEWYFWRRFAVGHHKTDWDIELKMPSLQTYATIITEARVGWLCLDMQTWFKQFQSILGKVCLKTSDVL